MARTQTRTRPGVQRRQTSAVYTEHESEHRRTHAANTRQLGTVLLGPIEFTPIPLRNWSVNARGCIQAQHLRILTSGTRLFHVNLSISPLIIFRKFKRPRNHYMDTPNWPKGSRGGAWKILKADNNEYIVRTIRWPLPSQQKFCVFPRHISNSQTLIPRAFRVSQRSGHVYNTNKNSAFPT